MSKELKVTAGRQYVPRAVQVTGEPAGAYWVLASIADDLLAALVKMCDEQDYMPDYAAEAIANAQKGE